MDTQKIDLDNTELLSAYAKLCWNSADRSDQFLRFACANPDVPLLFPTGRH